MHSAWTSPSTAAALQASRAGNIRLQEPVASLLLLYVCLAGAGSAHEVLHHSGPHFSWSWIHQCNEACATHSLIRSKSDTSSAWLAGIYGSLVLSRLAEADSVPTSWPLLSSVAGMQLLCTALGHLQVLPACNSQHAKLSMQQPAPAWRCSCR